MLSGIGNTKRLAKRRASHQMIQHLKEVELPSDVCTADDDDTDGIEQVYVTFIIHLYNQDMSCFRGSQTSVVVPPTIPLHMYWRE